MVTELEPLKSANTTALLIINKRNGLLLIIFNLMFKRQIFTKAKTDLSQFTTYLTFLMFYFENKLLWLCIDY